MRTLDRETERRFAAGRTTLCTCWRVTRRDGAEAGFTDHDEDVRFGGTTFSARSGATPTALRTTTGLEPDDAEFASVLSGEGMIAADLDAGRYDDASVQMWRVDWTAPEARILLRTGRIGEIVRAGEGYTATFRSLKGQLEGMTGRRYGRACDARIGDERCGLDLTAPALSLVARLTSVDADGSRVTISDADAGLAPSLFAGGTLTPQEGALASLSLPVRHAERGVTGLVVSLWRAVPGALTAGTLVRLTAGCDKRLSTCRAFGNVVNFRGHPHMPGNDVLTATPSPGEPS